MPGAGGGVTTIAPVFVTNALLDAWMASRAAWSAADNVPGEFWRLVINASSAATPATMPSRVVLIVSRFACSVAAQSVIALIIRISVSARSCLVT